MRTLLAVLLALFSINAVADSINILQPGQSTTDVPLLTELSGAVFQEYHEPFTLNGIDTIGDVLGSASSAIFQDFSNDFCAKCLSADFGLTLNGTGGSITSITLNGFAGAIMEVGVFAGSAMPTMIIRSADGDAITFLFGPDGLPANGNVAFLLETSVSCDAENGGCITHTSPTNLNFNGTNVNVVNFAPVVMAESGALFMLAVSLSVCAGAAALKRQGVS